MQIHELNNFSGTLGSGAYLAVDDGNDTGKLSTQQLLAATEARIDNIIAGEAPSAEEIVDARLGDDGVTYPSLGDAIRDQFSDVKSALSDLYDNTIAPTMVDGKYVNYSNGNLITDASSAYTVIAVEEGMKLHLRNLYITGDRSVCWYKASGFGGCFAHATSDKELVITIPATAVSIKATAKANETIEVRVVGEIDKRIDNLESSIDSVSAKIDERGTLPLTFEWSKFEKPSEFLPTIPFDIYTDGHNFKTNFLLDDYLNTGGTTYYTAPNAPSGNDGLTRATPRMFSNIYSNAVDGDTIILLEGDYDRDSLAWGNTIIQKNINISGEGRCRIFAGSLGKEFTQTADTTNVYQATQVVAKRVIDYKSLDGQYIAYEAKTSVASVDATEGSYYIDGNTVYVHAIGHGNPSALVCITVDSEKFLFVNNANGNTKVVYKNIELIGKPDNVLFNRSNTSNSLTVVCENVRAYYCGKPQRSALCVYGGTAIFNKCISKYAYHDGFNYNGVNSSSVSTDTLCIEIDCIGASCGHMSSAENENGSTAHIGAKVVRINGIYYDNKGANVADVQTDTMSLNLGCKAFYSAGTQGGANENFAAQQSGATMWLYGCVGVGAVKDLSCVSGSTMHLDKCTYKVKAGAGTYDEQNTLPFDIYTLYKTSEIG